jgi:cyclopropane-fatty-acyl-phospholipid synthase
MRTGVYSMANTSDRRQVVFPPEQQLYQSYSPEEDKERTNVHYEQPVEFFYLITGGEWNVYSCNLWEEGIESDTESQEAKLDLLAQLVDLKPGQRILDVGCGWGGPLVYLCNKYGASGVGLTLSSTQKKAADERIARHGADAQVIESHWKDYTDDRGFDLVYTDEVIVHFHDLGDFFSKAYSLLRVGGRLLNKELHFTHKRYSAMTRAMSRVQEIYGSTGNYRTLAEELTLEGEAGFEVQRIHQMPLTHYRKTLERWLDNMKEHRRDLEALAGAEYYKRFETYLRIVRHVMFTRTMTLDFVIGAK